jgi:putative transposase
MQQIYYPRSFYFVSRHGPIELSSRAAERLRWLKAWRALIENGLSSQQAADALQMARATLYRWERRLKTEGPRGLEDRSRRPRRCRRPQWTPELAEAVQQYREQYGWDKEKLAVLLKRNGWQTSASTVGRILKRLKARGVLREPLRNGIRTHKRSRKRPYATRKPRDYQVRLPGDWCPGRYAGCTALAWCCVQAVHGARYDFALGCHSSLSQRHGSQCSGFS